MSNSNMISRGDRFLQNFLAFTLGAFFFGVLFSISVMEIFKALLLVATLLVFLRHRKSREVMSPLHWWVIGLALWFLLTGLVHYSPHVLKRFPHYWSQLALFFSGSLLASWLRYRKLLGLAGVMAAAAGFYSLLQFLFGWNIPNPGVSWITISGAAAGGRVSGTHIYPNYNAQALSVMFLWLFPWFSREKSSNQKGTVPWLRYVLVGGALLLALGGLFATGTRSAWAGTALVLLLVFGFTWGWKKTLPLLLGAALLVLFLAPQNYQNRIARAFDPDAKDYVLRGIIFEASLKMAADYPLFGVGPGNFADKYRHEYLPRLLAETEHKFGEAERNDLQRHFHSHNNLLMLAASTGIPGMVLFLVLLVLLVREAWQRIREAAASGTPWVANIPFLALMVVLTLFVQGLLDYTLFGVIGGQLFWFFAGVAVARPRSSQESGPQITKPRVGH